MKPGLVLLGCVLGLLYLAGSRAAWWQGLASADAVLCYTEGLVLSWPLLGFPEGLEAYDALMVAGRSGIEPRLTPVPVRLPLPPADLQGSIYENQKGLKNRFFSAPVAAQ